MKKKLFGFLLTLCILLCVLSLQVMAADEAPSGTCGEHVTWAYEESTGTLTIEGTGRMRSYGQDSHRSYMQYDIKSVVIKNGVTSIGDHSFFRCSNLKSVTIPDSVISIGEHAFHGCSDLTSIHIPASVSIIGYGAFVDCSSLTNVNVPDGIKSIAGGLFYGCSSLTGLDIPESVTSIGHEAFGNCSGMMSIKLPDGLTDIGNEAFVNCVSLKSIEIPDGVTNIGNMAFENCSGLTKIQLPNGATTMGYNAFADCDSLTGVYIPNGVTKISDSAFYDCDSLTDVTLSEGLTTISEWAFAGCSKLKSVELPNSVTYVGGNAFDFVVYSKDKTILWKAPGSLSGAYTIPETVTTIAEGAFMYCEGLTAITIPKFVTKMGTGAFYGCKSLSTVTIPDSITYIPQSAFYECAALSAVIIPDSVTNIGYNAFYGCSSLTELLVPDSVTYGYSSIFEGYIYNKDKTRLLQVPKDLSGAYTIPDGVTRIGYKAFNECDGLTSIKFPDSLTAIDSSAFAYCDGLTSIVLPDGVITVDSYAFEKCENLKRIEIPVSITTLSGRAFEGCSDLRDLYYAGTKEQWDLISMGSWGQLSIPETATIHMDVIDKAVEPNCTKSGMTEGRHCVGCGKVKIAQEVIPAKDHTFVDGRCTVCLVFEDPIHNGVCGENVIWNFNEETSTLTIKGEGAMDNGTPWEAFRNSITTVVVQEGVTSLGDSSFWRHGILQQVELPNGLTSIGDLAFCVCYALEEIDIPDSVTSIGTEAFKNCNAMKRVRLPNSLTSIGALAFYGCWELSELILPPNLAVVSNEAFAECYGLSKLIVPDSITHIQSGAFANNYCLSKIYFCGTEEQWNEIVIAAGAIPSDAKIHFNYCAHQKQESIPGVAASCTEEGLSDGARCAKCGVVVKEQKSIPALGHEYGEESCIRCGTLQPSPFSDVMDTDWYFKPVLWAVRTGVTNGLSPESFGPNGNCTRAQVVTFLYAAAGKPEVTTTDNPFEDVADDAWYLKPVLWAVENGITGGVSEGKFGPDHYCTRAQVVTFLYAAAGKPEVTASSTFTDVADTDWYAKPVIWAKENNVTGGISATEFGPGQTCTRAQVVTFLYKVYNK